MNNLDKLQQMDNIQVNPENEEKEDQTIEQTIEGARIQLSPAIGSKVQRPFKLGVCGGHSSGKALVTERIAEKLKQGGYKIKIVKQDNFDIDSDEIFEQKENSENPQIPFINVKEWENFKINAHQALDSGKEIDVVIIEGTLIFHDESLRQRFDFKVFLDHDPDVRLSRKIFKEVIIKQKNIKTVVQTYLSKLKPLFENFIKPSKRYADVIVPSFGGGFSENSNPTQAGIEKNDHTFIDLLFRFIKAGF